MHVAPRSPVVTLVQVPRACPPKIQPPPVTRLSWGAAQSEKGKEGSVTGTGSTSYAHAARAEADGLGQTWCCSLEGRKFGPKLGL